MNKKSNIVVQAQQIVDEMAGRLAKAKTQQQLFDHKNKALNRKTGQFTTLMSSLGQMSIEDKKKYGPKLNQLKQELEQLFTTKEQELQRAGIDQRLASEYLDMTLPPYAKTGSINPLSQAADEIVDILRGMGFAVATGPEIETEANNFDQLNIPADHPARDMWDTYWLEDGNLLRTHTSPVQIRAMSERGVPIRVIAPGRTFRYEALDARHETDFMQIEGLCIDRNISIANLWYVLEEFIRAFTKQDITIRLRPGYFPFVEPGFEVDASCTVCHGDGCGVCKGTGWVELLGAGMVHPQVLLNVGLDPQAYNGFAFGTGIERLSILRYGIEDIRHFRSGDLRFLKQFS